MNFAPRKHFLVIVSLLLAVCVHGSDSNTTTPPFAMIREIRARQTSEAEKQRAYSELLRNELWSKQAWESIADLAIRCRFDTSKLDSLEQKRISDRPSFSESDEVELRREIRKKSAATESKDELHATLRLLEQIRDPRVISLVGPLLFEEDKTVFLGDAFVQSTQMLAASFIETLSFKGVRIPEPPRGLDDEAGWRTWWKKNREKFGVIRTLSPKDN